jgi:glutamate racemase
MKSEPAANVTNRPSSHSPAATCAAPIGIFDSGVGGLSVAVEVARQLPREHILYYADSARAPWGVRDPAELRSLACAITRYLLDAGAKLILVACNTASVHTLRHLRDTFPQVPFVGMVPAVKPAALSTLSGRIAVMATAATAQGQPLADLLSEFAEPTGVEAVLAVPAGLVELVEKGIVDGPEAEEVVHRALDPLLSTEVDTLVLGCTHFPFLRKAVEKVTQGRMQLIDAAPAVARQCGRVLMDRGIAARSGQTGGLKAMRIVTSGDPQSVAAVVKKLLGVDVSVEHRDAVAAG